MKMTLYIYKNGELVNEMHASEPAAIYKELATIYFAKDRGRATRTATDYLNGKLKVTQTFDQTKTQLPGVIYKYCYIFEEVYL